MKKGAFAIFAAVLAATQICVSAGAATTVLDLSESDEWYYHGVFYGRGIQLQTDEAGDNKGKLYATSEYYYYPNKRYGHEHFPIFESSDGGKTFEQIGAVRETEYNTVKYIKDENGTYIEAEEGAEGATRMYNEYWGLIYQPILFELPEKLGALEKGTVLCGGLAKGSDHSAIEVYYSTDGLRNWTYLSTVAMGGKAEMEKASAIWEPYFIYENGALYCFYSDERGMQGGGQRLVYAKSTDGINWSEDVKVCDFEEENSRYRPGMPVVTKLKNGKFMMIYEGVNMGTHVLPIYYKVTDNIEEWNYPDHGTLMPHPIDGGSPFCATMPDGTVVAGACSTGRIAVNTDNLETNRWVTLGTSITNAYSRSLFPLSDGRIMITSGGSFSGSDPRKLECSVEAMPIISKIVVGAENVTGSPSWGATDPNRANAPGKVVDGDSQTFYDADKNAELIIDLGSDYEINAIGFEPRYHFIERMNGGTFYASEDRENWNEIYKITQNPSENSLTYVGVSLKNVSGKRYRYVKYTTNGAEVCSVAEIEIYSKEAMTISVNGKTLSWGQKRISENEILVPMRMVCEELGASVSWDNDAKAAVATFDGGVLEAVCGENATLIDGVTYVDIQKISEKSGCTYYFDEDRNCIRIMYENEKKEVTEKHPSALRIVSATATAEPQPENSIKNAYDGDLNTVWAAANIQSITFDMGKVYMLTGVSPAFKKYDDNRTIPFRVYIFDGQTETKIYDGSSVPNSGGFMDLDVSPDREGRYVRIEVDGASSSHWTSLAEVLIYGYDIEGEDENKTPSVTLTGVCGATAEIKLSGEGGDLLIGATYASKGVLEEVKSFEIENLPCVAQITFDKDIAEHEIKLFMWHSKNELVPLVPAYKAQIGRLNIASAVASSEPEPQNSAKNSYDGSLSTFWASNKEQNIVYDLGKEYTVMTVSVAFLKYEDDRTIPFKVSVSADNESWTEVYSGSSIPLSGDFMNFAVSGENARYVKLDVYGNTKSGWTSLAEVEVYGIK